MPLQIPIPDDLRKLMRFGSGVGVEIGDKDLEVVAARVRPSRIRVLGRLVIPDFASRPAAEWGAEYARFLKSLGATHLTATVLLPRREVIVRMVSLPGVSSRDMEGALRLELDSLHPYGEDEVAWGWSYLAPGAALVGIARRSVVERYIQAFTGANIPVSSFTFSAAVLHAAVRLQGDGRPAAFVALGRTASGAFETYGESPSRPVFSAEFDLPAQRAAALALAELRLPPDTAPFRLEDTLPQPSQNPVENDLSRNALPYATALAGACPRLAPSANVLPPEYRKFSSRAMFIPTIALAALLLLCLAGGWVWSRAAERAYLAGLRAQTARLEPLQKRAQKLDRDAADARARAQWLDQYRTQTRRDLDVLSDLTRLIESPAWTTGVDITRDAVKLQGEAGQATSLFKIVNSSAFLKNTRLEYEQPNPAGGENFVISAAREAAK
jgi:Tfp pilus assembly protein PilN